MTKKKQSPVLALGLAALLGTSGVLHMVRGKNFDRLVPETLPGPANLYTKASGVGEMAIAAALLNPKTRRLGGLWAGILFIAVFPGNIKMAMNYVNDPRKGFRAQLISIVRLPLQVPLYLAARAVRRSS